MVRIHPDPPGSASSKIAGPPSPGSYQEFGAVAQLGERLLCKQEVVGSIPSSSTSLRSWFGRLRLCVALNGALCSPGGAKGSVESCSVL
jgi:hypothetical protein